MTRHRFDPISFVFGAAFAALAAAVALPGDPWRVVLDGLTLGWVWPVVIIAMGIAVLVPALRRDEPSPASDEEAPEAPDRPSPGG